MTYERLKLEEILGHDFILTDSMKNSPDYWYEKQVYRATDFGELNRDSLLEGAESLDIFLRWLLNPNVFTMQRCSEEVRRFNLILQEKMKFMKGEEAEILRTGIRSTCFGRRAHRSDIERKKSKRRLCINMIADPENEALFKELCTQTFRVYEASQRSLFVPPNQAIFDELNAAVQYLAKISGAKISYGSRYGSYSGKAEDLKADEELVAGALYSSLYLDREVQLVSRDSDLGRILAVCFKYFTHPDFPQSGDIKATLARHPIRYYFVKNFGTFGTYLTVDTSRPDYGQLETMFEGLEFDENVLASLQALPEIPEPDVPVPQKTPLQPLKRKFG